MACLRFGRFIAAVFGRMLVLAGIVAVVPCVAVADLGEVDVLPV